MRQLADEADRQLERQDDFGNGLAVSLAQDAVELFIRVVVLARHIVVPARAAWEVMADAINKKAVGEEQQVPHRARIEDLNKARVAFKHTGTCPARADAQRLVRFGMEFLEVACPRFFDIEYRSISLAHAVSSAQVRGLLTEAQRRADAGEYREAIIEAADAVRLAEGTLSTLIPQPVAVESGAGYMQLLSFVAGLRLVSLGALVGFDLRELMRFRAIAPRVWRSPNGQREVVFTAPIPNTPEHAAFAIRFAVDFALAVQRKLGSRIVDSSF